MPAIPNLPIEDVLPDIRAALREGNQLIITAPPGAGKTTRVPLAMLEDDWTKAGRIVLVVPRRIAARAAAERMAQSLAERVGQTIGLRSRLDVRTSRDARIEVVTEGVFTRMVLSDPALEGVAAVLFDEVHERSLDGDEGLAFALDAQSVLREDLRVVLMSATLPPEIEQGFLSAPVIRSDGRAWPVETRYLGFDARMRMEDQVAAAVRQALAEQPGSILVFLPGAAEIRRTAERLDNLPGGTEVRMLYGALSPADQTAAIAPASDGRRKVVLSTDVAESSLTIEGVRVVVDAGFARVPRYDASLGVSRLETVRVAVANADQRRGRAGRTGPGVCYRLWREAEMQGFRAAPAPEIQQADLSGLRLDVARWGARSPDSLIWLTPPHRTAWDAATATLRRHGALDNAGDLTELGKRIADYPLPPRLAMMVSSASAGPQRVLAAEIAAILSERDLGGRSTDLADRLFRFRSGSDQRTRAMRDLARRWGGAGGSGEADPAVVLATAFPERIARARPGAPGRFIMAGGRGAMVDETDPLAKEPWLAVADVSGGGADLRITLAARLDAADALSSGDLRIEDTAELDPSSGAVRARRTRSLGAIVLDVQPLAKPSPEVIAAAVAAAVRAGGFAILPDNGPLQELIDRVDFLSELLGDPWPAGFSAALLDTMGDWLAPLCTSSRPFSGTTGPELAAAAAATLPWPLPRDLERLAPLHWQTPAGRRVPVSYSGQGRPAVECKVQEAFGLGVHPSVAGGRAPLTMRLLSPAMRPVAVTQDLPGFWRTGYPDVRKDLRGRYPKHDWPEDPSVAAPTSRAKPRT